MCKRYSYHYMKIPLGLLGGPLDLVFATGGLFYHANSKA
uniref:Uncharacterized protein n=1 Tax=Rhizophora mucronata TaxID=61149 RepID=A0A2P2QAT1_RHIMU